MNLIVCYQERMLYVTDPTALYAILSKDQQSYEEPPEFLMSVLYFDRKYIITYCNL